MCYGSRYFIILPVTASKPKFFLMAIIVILETQTRNEKLLGLHEIYHFHFNFNYTEIDYLHSTNYVLYFLLLGILERHQPIRPLRRCLVCVFKQSFSVFKQHFTHFNTLFHPHVFPQIFLNNNFQFLNTYTKRALTILTDILMYTPPLINRIPYGLQYLRTLPKWLTLSW